LNSLEEKITAHYQCVRQIQNYKSNASILFIFIFINDFILDKYKFIFN